VAFRLTYFTTGLARAGAETQVLLLSEVFVKAGWDVSVISLLKPEAYEEELRALGVPLISLNLSRRFPNPMTFWRLVEAIRALRPDVLHCHQVHANIAGRAARLFTGTPALVCTAHSITEGPRWREWAYRLTDGLCDVTTNVCQAGVERYIRVGAAPPSKILYVPNAIDIRRFAADPPNRAPVRQSLGIPGDAFVWLAIGNLRLPKDYPTMIEGFRQVVARQPGACLLIAGAGPLAAELEAQVAAGAIPGIRFLGARSDVAGLLSAADGFLMSSSWEGTPLALLEASAASLPVVATRVGGIAEVVADGVSGYLVPPGDPAALAGACLRVMGAAPEHQAALGAAGRRIVEESFSLETLRNQWQQIYEQILRQPQCGPLEREAV
jgi:glycosyltransferase involved in cell wall biosynthesis